MEKTLETTPKWTLLEATNKNKDDMATFQLNQDPYKGVKVKFGALQMNEDEQEENCVLSFEFDIQDEKDKHLETDEAFQTYLGNILVELLEDAVADENFTLGGHNNEN